MSTPVDIIPFHSSHQAGIDEMMAGINEEFGRSIFPPVFKKIEEYAAIQGNNYWVARDSNKVAGTVGLNALSYNRVMLRSMFVNKDFRHSDRNVAAKLLETAQGFARENQYREMFLGTMEQFKAAQRFYEKNGFEKIPQEELPVDFVLNPLDSVFYKKTL